MTIYNDFQLAKLVSEEDFDMLMYWLRDGSRVKSLKRLKCKHFESSWDSKYAHGFVIKIKAEKSMIEIASSACQRLRHENWVLKNRIFC